MTTDAADSPDPRAGRDDVHVPSATVLGRSHLTRDIIARAVADAGMSVIDLRDGRDRAVDIALLVDPEPHDWETATAIAREVVLVSSEEVRGPALPEAIRRGAAAVVDLGTGVPHVVETVAKVARHGVALTTDQTRWLVEAVRNRSLEEDARSTLSGREMDVLESIARGESLKQTARALGISVKTVENVQSRLYLKLGVRTRAHAVARAHDIGVLTLAEGDDPKAGPGLDRVTEAG
jgi:DNA-binding NarL/FixJ family response regulator